MSVSDVPTASEIDVTEPSTKLSPAEIFMTAIERLEEKMLKFKTLQKEIDTEFNALKKASKKAVKFPKGSRKGTHPKGETPKQIKGWNNFVKETQQKMITEGWASFESKGKTLPAGIQVDGKWVFDTEDEKKRVAPNFKAAMSYASFRKANGEYTSPEKPAKEEKPKSSRGRKPKADKPVTGGAGAKSDSEEEKPAKKTVVTDSDSESESDEETLTTWTHKGKKYYRSDNGECWHINSNGTQGKWAGKYNPDSDKIDTTVEEP